MKRTVSIMTLSLLTATTLANATPSEQMNFTSLNQSDSHMLFEKTPNSVIALGESEMRDTEGEFWPIFWGVVYFTVQYANAPSVGGKIYHGYPYARGRWRWLNW